MKTVIFMDYENIYWSMKQQYGTAPDVARLIAGLRDLAEQKHGGPICLMQAYADFDHEEFRGLLSELQRRSVEPRHVFSKNYEDGTRKNAADIEMSLDALELMYNRPDIEVFVLVCGDRDMIQVIRKLRGRGKQVHVVAVEKTMSKDVLSFANQFSTIEALMGLLPPALHDMEVMIRRLDSAEYGKPFVGLKYFLRVLAGSDIVDRKTYELVNQAISEGIIETYKVPNPKDELFPTTACRLNRDHELVRRVLAAASGHGQSHGHGHGNRSPAQGSATA
ncbi:MAG: NYN domain-containing protein [Bacillota bacterium]